MVVCAESKEMVLHSFPCVYFGSRFEWVLTVFFVSYTAVGLDAERSVGWASSIGRRVIYGLVVLLCCWALLHVSVSPTEPLPTLGIFCPRTHFWHTLLACLSNMFLIYFIVRQDVVYTDGLALRLCVLRRWYLTRCLCWALFVCHQGVCAVIVMRAIRTFSVHSSSSVPVKITSVRAQSVISLLWNESDFRWYPHTCR